MRSFLTVWIRELRGKNGRTNERGRPQAPLSRLDPFGVATGSRRADGFFTSRCDVDRTGSRENRLGAVDLLGGIAVSGQEHAAVFDPSLVPFRLVFGNPHADEGAHDAADGSSHAETRQRAHDRTRGNQRSDARNREGTDTGEQTE